MDTHPTELIAENFPELRKRYSGKKGSCCFCSKTLPGQPRQDIISDYFTNDDLMNLPNSTHVCHNCITAMKGDQTVKNGGKKFKNGHWIATPDEYNNFSTGDAKQVLQNLHDDEYKTPYALHITDNAIRSEHAYHWTPVSCSTEQLTIDYARQKIHTTYGKLMDLVDDIEELRANGFRIDEIKSGRPTTYNIEELGKKRYQEIEERMEKHRPSPLFSLAVKISESQ